MRDEVRYYDKHGRETKSVISSYSKVIMNPHNFDFYIKTYSLFWAIFGKEVVKWKYSHTSSTFGSWMWPEGLPLRFDGVDNDELAFNHSIKIGSDWFKNETTN